MPLVKLAVSDSPVVSESSFIVLPILTLLSSSLCVVSADNNPSLHATSPVSSVSICSLIKFSYSGCFLNSSHSFFKRALLRTRTGMNSQSPVARKTSPQGRKKRKHLGACWMQWGVSVSAHYNGKLFLGYHLNSPPRSLEKTLLWLKTRLKCRSLKNHNVKIHKGEKYDCIDLIFPLSIFSMWVHVVVSVQHGKMISL